MNTIDPSTNRALARPFQSYRWSEESRQVTFIGTEPSRKSVKRIIERIHDETTPRWNLDPAEKRVAELNALLRGWSGYFIQGRVIRAYRVIRQYTERRLRRWLIRRQGKRGTGYRQYPDVYLYERLGLYRLPDSRAAVAKAKA